ncbi:hypothetical protein MOD31_00150 [Paenarthrobacter sp. TYUT067]|uniref:hypothetical protein n=1 Tax=Paenarthrobacter sp. TYUT067 TaxID=2926245 RepID=UPI00203052BF|nr:hypothetical protein [Paenarthrobacter sp. TYUT067]MCM0614427.1 hypothetical protein [Paenarthrobacter sp. TYUT067]
MTDAPVGGAPAESVTAPTAQHLLSLYEIIGQADEDIPEIGNLDHLEDALGKLAQRFAVHSAYDVLELLRDGGSALLAGSVSRAILETAVSEQWYQSRPAEEFPRNATLAIERDNIRSVVAELDVSVPNLARWNNPIPDIRFAHAALGPALPNLQTDLSGKARTSIERITALPAPIVDLLAMCSHVSHTALWMAASDDGPELGVSSSLSFGAVLSQTTGTALAAIRGLSGTALSDLVDSATRIHEFEIQPSAGRDRLVESMRAKKPAKDAKVWLETPPPPALNHLLDEVKAKATEVWRIINDAPNPFQTGSPVNLTSALPYLQARDLMWQVIKAVQGQAPPLSSPAAARMLLEQAGDIMWRLADSSDEQLRARYNAHMDSATDRKENLYNSLRARTSSPEAVEKLLYPRGRGSFAIDTRRQPRGGETTEIPLPRILLGGLVLGVAEPNWGELAYKLLTQVAHATPLGLLHSFARFDESTQQHTLSHEMTALAIDAACIGIVYVMRGLAPLIAHQANLPRPDAWLEELRIAVTDVHAAAMLVHFLG